MEPFLSEIRIFSFIYAPRGWALCNGQLLPINQNQALFSLLGTTYGGNGQTTFALPDLRGRTQLHFDGGHTLGERSGEETHTLSAAELPTHTHALNASTSQASTNVPANNTVLSASNPQNVYGPASNPIAMDPSAIGNSGGSQPHTNQQPFLTLSFCIALQGIFPSHT
jgi:microcystin-dependent protein